MAPHKLERRMWLLKRFAPDQYYKLIAKRFEKLARKMAKGA